MTFTFYRWILGFHFTLHFFYYWKLLNYTHKWCGKWWLIWHLELAPWQDMTWHWWHGLDDGVEMSGLLIKRLVRIKWQAFLQHWIRKGKGGKVEAEIKQGRVGLSRYNKILCRNQFTCVISLLDLTCMVLSMAFCYYGMGFSRCGNAFTLVFPFPDSHGVIGFSCFGWVGLPDGSKLSEVDLWII